jgi:hypothetical protein
MIAIKGTQSRKASVERLRQKAEVPLRAVELHDISQKGSQHTRVADAQSARRWNGGSVVAKIRHAQVAKQFAAVGMRVRTHASGPGGRKCGEFRL